MVPDDRGLGTRALLRARFAAREKISHFDAAWPVRDQGYRRTCVAHAALAALEHAAGRLS